MKNKKGFTLIELLAVIVILSIILVIGVPSLIKNINNKKLEASDRIKEMVISTGRSYVVDNNLKAPLAIPIEDLCGYIECPIIDPYNNSELSGFVTADEDHNYKISNAVKLTGDLNGGSSGQTFGNSYAPWTKVELEVPVKSGFDFSHWEVVRGNGIVNGNSVTVGDRDTEVYAMWVSWPTLTVDYDGGIPSDTLNATYKSGEIIELKSPTKEGYTFSHWVKESGNGILSGSSFTMGSVDTKIKAIWIPNTYTINYTLNGGTSGTNKPVTGTYDSVVTIDYPTKPGYTFAGWKVGGYDTNARYGTSSDALVNEITSSDLIIKANYFKNLNSNESGNVTLTANYTAQTYTITFDTSGGSASVSEMDVTYDSEYSGLPTPTRTGYTFAGWYIGDTQVKNGDKVQITSDTELIAKWTANTYTINYALNSGSYGTNHPTSGTYDSVVTIDNPTRSGYIFNGWTISGYEGTARHGTVNTNVTTSISSATSKVMSRYFKNLTADASGSVTLTANWTAGTYTVSLSANGGSTSVTSVNATYDSEYSGLPIPTRDGYTFNGWYISGTKINNGDKVTITGNATATASWTANTYTINYALNSGSYGTNHPTTGTYDSVVTIDNPTRTGYTFAGWTVTSGLNTETAKHGTSNTTVTNSISSATSKVMSIYFKNLTADASGSVTLTANWTAGTYTVSLSANGGSTSVTSVNATYDSEYSGLPTPTKDGYTFNGWYIDTVKIDNGDKVTITGNATAIASWTPITYTISYVLNSGSYGTNHPTSGTYDSNVTIDNPTRTGYTFTGWTISGYEGTARHGTSSSAVTSTIASTSTLITSTYFKNLRTTSGTVTLTANWTANTYTISYALNSGSYGTNHPTSGTYDSVVTINNPTRSGYIFNGWTISGYEGTARHGTSSSAVTSTIASTSTLITSTYFKNLRSSSGTVTLTANWTPNTYTVVYNCNGGSGSMSNSTFNFGQASTLRTSTCTKSFTTGTSGKVYYFKGWSTSSGSTTVSYNDGASVTDITSGSSITLYAVYDSLFTSTASYNLISDGGSNWRVQFKGSGSVTFTKGVALDLFLVGGGGSGNVGFSMSYYCVPGGGGGGCYANSTYGAVTGYGGAGGSGIVVIRNAR